MLSVNLNLSQMSTDHGSQNGDQKNGPVNSATGGASTAAERKDLGDMALKVLIGGAAIIIVSFVLISPVVRAAVGQPHRQIEYVDPFKLERSGEPDAQWSIFDRYFCRGGRKSWFCGTGE